MIATAKPGKSAAVEIVDGTNRVVRGHAAKIKISTHERTDPTIAPATLITALSPRIIRSTRLRLHPTARKIPNSFVRSTTDINIVLRMLANESTTMEMEHRTTYLATVGTLGPMIGLVGTAYGMIMAFRVVAVEDSLPQAGQLAAGISTALYSTLEGIAISIPAIFFYAMFRNRIARLSLEVGMATESLLEQFAPGVRTATPEQGASAAPGSA